MRALILLMITASGTATTLAQPMSEDPQEIRFVRITDNIHVAYQSDPLQYWVEGNVTIIINDRDVVVVDAGGTPRAARKVISYIREVTEKPVRYLVNTHGHGDHTIGNQVYREEFPGIEIIGHQYTAEYVSGSGYDYVEEIAESTESRKRTGEQEIARLLREDPARNERVVRNLIRYYRHDIDIRQREYRNVIRTPPTALVDDHLRLHRGSRTIDILHVGPGNTPGDLLVFLPNERIIITGDVVTHPVPFGFSRYPIEWMATLTKLQSLNYHTLIPGHGEIQRGPGYVESMIRLFESLLAKVRRGLSAGMDHEHLRRTIDLTVESNEFVGEDPVGQYYFHEYFTLPATERMFNSLNASQRK